MPQLCAPKPPISARGQPARLAGRTDIDRRTQTRPEAPIVLRTNSIRAQARFAGEDKAAGATRPPATPINTPKRAIIEREQQKKQSQRKFCFKTRTSERLLCNRRDKFAAQRHNKMRRRGRAFRGKREREKFNSCAQLIDGIFIRRTAKALVSRLADRRRRIGQLGASCGSFTTQPRPPVGVALISCVATATAAAAAAKR